MAHPSESTRPTELRDADPQIIVELTEAPERTAVAVLEPWFPAEPPIDERPSDYYLG